MLGVHRINNSPEPAADQIYQYFPADRVWICCDPDQGDAIGVLDVVELMYVHRFAAIGLQR